MQSLQEQGESQSKAEATVPQHLRANISHNPTFKWIKFLLKTWWSLAVLKIPLETLPTAENLRLIF